MKSFYKKIRKMLAMKKTRRQVSHVLMVFACVVVFITTYTLILPAITMEKGALICGKEVHEHADSCYADVLVCGLEESEGHTHTDECYHVDQILICEIPEHEHTEECLDEEGNLICELEEHQHEEPCYEEIRTLICGQEESEGHIHTENCYEKQMICGMEYHIHTQSCYAETEPEENYAADIVEDTVGENEEAQAQDNETGETAETSYIEETSETQEEEKTEANEENKENKENKETEITDETSNTEETDNTEDKEEVEETENTKETDNAEEEETKEGNENVEETDNTDETEKDTSVENPDNTHPPVNFAATLTDNTGLWILNSESVWEKLDENTAIKATDNILVRLAYHIPAGSLDEHNAEVIYHLPKALLFTQEKADFINEETNYLNQIISGTRLPEEMNVSYTGDEYLAGKYQIANSAADLSEGEMQDWQLTCTFNEYSVYENQTQDSDGWMIFYLTGADLMTDENGNGTILFTESGANGQRQELGYHVAQEETAPEDESEMAEETSGEDETTAAEENSETEETVDTEETTDVDETTGTDETTDAEETTDSEETTGTEENVDDKLSNEYPVQTFEATTDTMVVTVYAGNGAFPAGTTMTVTDVDDEETVQNIVDVVNEASEKNTRSEHVLAADISFYDKDGQKIEPLRPIQVAMNPKNKPETISDEAEPVIVHLDDAGNTEIIEQRDVEEVIGEIREEEIIRKEEEESKHDDAETMADEESVVDETSAEVESDGESGEEGREEQEEIEEKENEDTSNVINEDASVEDILPLPEDAVVFEAEQFSVYAVVYTVDFHWEVNGKTFEFSIPGGSYISFYSLIEILGIEVNDINTDKDEIRELVDNVESITFSDPELVWVGKAEEETTVGGIKDSNKLECEYSEELTDEQIEKINSQIIRAGDWVLISIKPFESNENLTVTMRNGDQFVIRVTDALVTGGFNGKSFLIKSRNPAYAMTTEPVKWDGNQEYLRAKTPADSNDQIWILEYVENYAYRIKTVSDNKYILVRNYDVYGLYGITLTDNPNYSTLFYIDQKNDEYRFITYINGQQKYLNFLDTFDTPRFTIGTNYNEYFLLEEKQVQNTERLGDWLIYLDEDLSEITLHVGETLTLRPYDEWTWKESNIQSAHWNVGGVSGWNIQGNESNGANKSTWTDGVFSWTRYVKYDDQLNTRYWSVQGKALTTGDYTLTNSKNSHSITVHVVDGVPVNKPETVKNTAGIKVNLFDYDRNYLLDPSDNTNLANNNNNKNDSINKEAGDSHFYFLSSGSGNKSNENWNSYTKDKNNPDIVKKELDVNGFPVLSNSNKSLQYLFDTSEGSRVWHGGNHSDAMIAYPDVEGMFQKDSNGFYYYNSNVNYFYYNAETGKSYLYKHTYTQTSGEEKGALVNDKPIGFFPFHDYDSTKDLYVNQNSNLNHHVGLSMDIDFILPTDKLDEHHNKFEFDFSGDDDLWVFLEWTDEQGVKQSKMMLDLGGIHQPITGRINFTDNSDIKSNTPYRLKVFYLERGGCDSNCSIRFNLPVVKELSLEKRLTGLTDAEREKYKTEEFVYEVIVNNQPYNGNNTIRTDKTGTVIKRGFYITNGQVKIKDGETVTITGLARTDTFYAAEEKSLNMEQFEVPHAERYYQSDVDGSQHEEEINLTESQTQGAATTTKDWKTPTYSLQDTEKVTFTNTLKEKDLEVDKKWEGERTHPDQAKFTVSASVIGDDGAPQPYGVSVLKAEDGTTDKEFVLNESNNWHNIIEHLPVQTPEGKIIIYDIKEVHVDGYISSTKDLTSEQYNYCNVDAVKLWPDDHHEDEVITIKLKNQLGQFYAGTDAQGKAKFDAIGQTFELTKDNNYMHRFARLPYEDIYTVVESTDQNEGTTGLVTYVRNIVQYQLTNTPVGSQVDPTDSHDNPEIHKRIDALRDGAVNPDSPHTGEDLTDLYRLYLDYKVNSLQEANGVDLIFVIDHSGSMNSNNYGGNIHRAPSVMKALNGENGFISQFLDMNKDSAGNSKNRWAAVGFKGPKGRKYVLDSTFRSENAGKNDSEILSGDENDYTWKSSLRDISLPLEGENWIFVGPFQWVQSGETVLTDYTAGFWRAEQFLLQEDVKNDGRKKAIVFISDGIPTLHIEGLDQNQSLTGADRAMGSRYYPDDTGGCPDQAKQQFGYFVNDMKNNGYHFGENMEFYTIGFGGIMQEGQGEALLREMLRIAYKDEKHEGHFMTINDVNGYYEFTDAAANKLKDDLIKIMGMNETFSNIVIQDDLSQYVDLYGLASAGTIEILKAAKVKVTMTDPADVTKTKTLYEKGALVAQNNQTSDFVQILESVSYEPSSKTVTATFNPNYKAQPGIIYTLSFDVKTTEEAYVKYADSGYDKFTEGEKQGQAITGDKDTDFLGTTPPNATSVGKDGFRSNDRAKVTYLHNGVAEEKMYPHPVIQVTLRLFLEKTDQTNSPLEGAVFQLYGKDFDPSKTLEQNISHKIGDPITSTKDSSGRAIIYRGGVDPGTYYLVETKSPDGYIGLEGPLKIEIVEVGGKMTLTASINGTAISYPKLSKSETTGEWNVKVTNSAGVELPSTGGSGNTRLYITGLLLIAFAGVTLLQRRERVA